MRIMVVGDWHSEVHEEWVYRAFQKLGNEVYPFKWHSYFKPKHFLKGALSKLEGFYLRLQNRFIAGPTVTLLNHDFLKAAETWKPDVLFIYLGTHIRPHTLKKIKLKNPEAVIIGYCNDNPFTPGHKKGNWRWFLRSIPYYDLMLAYRHQNLKDFQDAGGKRVRLLRSWFVPERNYPVTLSPDEQEVFGSEVVFVGNYEPVGRIEWLEEIMKNGFKLRLFGPGKNWQTALGRSPWLRHLAPVRQVWGEEYNKALCGAKVALCFFSKINKDTYTRRCFEIPATKTLLLSEYSDDLATLFQEGIEADFFRSKEELIFKLKLYIQNEALRNSVAEAGYKRVFADGHDVYTRMRQVLTLINEIRDNEKRNC